MNEKAFRQTHILPRGLKTKIEEAPGCIHPESFLNNKIIESRKYG